MKGSRQPHLQSNYLIWFLHKFQNDWKFCELMMMIMMMLIGRPVNEAHCCAHRQPLISTGKINRAWNVAMLNNYRWRDSNHDRERKGERETQRRTERETHIMRGVARWAKGSSNREPAGWLRLPPKFAVFALIVFLLVSASLHFDSDWNQYWFLMLEIGYVYTPAIMIRY